MKCKNCGQSIPFTFKSQKIGLKLTSKEKRYLMYILDTGYEIDPNISKTEHNKEKKILNKLSLKVYENLHQN